MPRYRVTDTITYERTWYVEARSEKAALSRIEKADDWDQFSFAQEQIDSTPYEVSREDEG
jgi:hypothetical protein